MNTLQSTEEGLRRARKALGLVLVASFFIASLACRQSDARVDEATGGDGNKRTVEVASPTVKKMIEAAIAQTTVTRSYDPSYVKLAYPNGDVPIETGVCSDVVIRAFRKVGIDLQRAVHEDMAKNFAQYPKKWGLKGPDTNIDHRRVPNLMTYFKRQGKAVPISAQAKDYVPGDIVAWDLGGGITHIGILTDLLSGDGQICNVVHNIGAGARVENILFSYKIIGHYRYF
jgi:uncharacterized protein YijF (DUF1287 family)